MNTMPTIFAQIMAFLPLHEFRKCVQRSCGDYKVRKFSCLDQFFCLAFAQLTYRESLRDIVSCLKAEKSRLCQMGIRGRVSRNNLAGANEARDWRIYADFAQVLMADARRLYRDEDRPVSVAFPLGSVPQTQGHHQARYASRSEGFYTNVYPYDTRKTALCPDPRRSPARAGFLLKPGSRISGFLSTLHPPSTPRVFRYPGQVESPVAPNLVSTCRHNHGPDPNPRPTIPTRSVGFGSTTGRTIGT